MDKLSMYVYWYHLPEHSNPYIEGYVGITKNLKRRDYEHRNGYGNIHLTRAFKKYRGIQKTILCKGTIEYCIELEQRLRPRDKIGWNIVAGGGLPPTGLATGKRKGVALMNIRQGAKKKRGKTSPFKGLTNRHSDKTKALIGSYHKGKIISEQHRQAVREKLSGSKNPKANQVLMFNCNNRQWITCKSVSDAAKAINISRAAMKSRIRTDYYHFNPNVKLRRKDGWYVVQVTSKN